MEQGGEIKYAKSIDNEVNLCLKINKRYVERNTSASTQ